MKNFFIYNGKPSMMRLISFLTVITALAICVLIVILVFLKTDAGYIKDLIMLSGILLGFGFGGKAVQKFGEKE